MLSLLRLMLPWSGEGVRTDVVGMPARPRTPLARIARSAKVSTWSFSVCPVRIALAPMSTQAECRALSLPSLAASWVLEDRSRDRTVVVRPICLALSSTTAASLPLPRLRLWFTMMHPPLLVSPHPGKVLLTQAA